MKLERKVKVTPHKREIHTHPTMGASIKYVHAVRWGYTQNEVKQAMLGEFAYEGEGI